MGLFKGFIKKRFFFNASRLFKPVVFENLEQRILLSGDDLSGITNDLSLVTTPYNNSQIVEYSAVEYFETDEVSTAYNELVPGIVVEQTEIVLYQSNSLEVGSLSLNSQGLQFNLNPAEGMSQLAIDAFQEAADLLSAIFSDDIIVNIDINFTSLAPGMLGSSSFTIQLFSYSNFLDALNNDKTSSNDTIAVNNLTTSSSLDVYINRTSNNPNGSGSPIPYLDNDSDANNNKIRLTTANAKALGLLDAGSTMTNATITFNSEFSWDFDRSDGITSGSFDFVGVALHEMCHALGFTSGVDILDDNPGMADNLYTYINPLDLFRFSDNSISAGADIDWTADTRSKFFSIDGGVSSLATFSTGVNFGDGYENSHWKDNLGFGIMDPTCYAGELVDITDLDTIALDVIGWDSSAISVQQLPYTQDFTTGLPDGSAGWEYYSDNEGRIQVVNGRLRLDDFGDNWDYSLNEAILHIDLTGQSTITLTLDHWTIADESTALPSEFTGHYNGDGISISVDGIHWVRITSLSGDFTNKSYILDTLLERAKTLAGSDDVSDVRVKLQQYDNTSENDGREFDNIQIISEITISVQDIPYTQDFESGQPGASYGWEYYSDNEGRIQVVNGRLRLDDFGDNWSYSLNEAILHVDLTGKTNVILTFDHWSLVDEYNALPLEFEGHNNGDGVALSADGIHWVTITSLNGSFMNRSYILDTLLERAKTLAGSDDVSDIQIKFQQYDNTSGNDGREFDNIQITSETTISVQDVPYSQNFDFGLPGTSEGWEYYSDNEGRISVVDGRLRLDDFGDNWDYSLNEAILHVDLTGKSTVILTLDHWNLSDENTSLPLEFESHNNGDGIALSIDGIHWVTITSLNGSFTNQSYVLDTLLERAKTLAGSDNVSDVQIKFQQYDNTSGNDGREFDNIQITSETTITVQDVPYTQDFESGQPGKSDGWEYYSDNEGRIQVVNGRLRLDDFGDNWSYSLNEAILHVDLTDKSTVILTLDHWNLSDENTALPLEFEGHYNGDGISISMDGIHWVTITSLSGSFTNQSYILDTLLERARELAGSDDVSDVQIKFQQYDNTIAPKDGREFDNIQITSSTSISAQDVPYSQDFASGLPGTTEGWEYYSDNEGRIQVVNGRLRLDDFGDNWDYSLNEAILHVDLSGKSNVTLTLDHWNLADENISLPLEYEGHYNGDGISLSVDGIHWVTITSLSGNFTNQSYILDTLLERAMELAGSDDVSDVQIKFQQYDNTSGNDGREFDNIQIA